MIFVMTIVYIVENVIFKEIKLEYITEENVLKLYSRIVIFNIIFNIVIFKMSKIDFFSPMTFFLIFGYVFHFGQLIINNIYKYDYLDYINVYMIEDMPCLIKTIKISINSLNLVCLGAILYKSVSKSESKSDDLKGKNIKNESKVCYLVGIVLFIISSPFRLWLDINQIIGAITNGYAGARAALSLPGIFSAIAGFWYSAILLIYVGKKNKKIFFWGIFYTALTMLTGNRGHQITNILVMLLVYIHIEEIKLKWNKILMISIYAYFLLVFIDMIMNFRNVGIQSFLANIPFYLNKSLKTNIILETIGTFGETLYTPFLVVKQMGKEINPFFGEAFLYSFGTLIPNIGNVTTYTNIACNFAKMLNTQNAIGGSFIGDIYYNFREAYGIIAILTGYIINKYSTKYKLCINRGKYSELIYYIPIFVNLFWWIRDSVGNELRPLIWQIFISYLISLCYRRKLKGNDRNEN